MQLPTISFTQEELRVIDWYVTQGRSKENKDHPYYKLANRILDKVIRVLSKP